MKKILLGGLLIFTVFSLNGCVYFFGDTAAIGFGKRMTEYYENGEVKSKTFESNSPMKDTVSIGKQN